MSKVFLSYLTHFFTFRMFSSALCAGILSVIVSTRAQDGEDSYKPAYGLDYSAQVGARSIPLGLAASGTVGYGHLLWGTNQKSSDFFYGYVRPSAKLQTSGVVTLTDLKVEVAPISPMVISFGHNDSFRLKDFSKIDCLGNACQGHLGRSYLAVSGIYGQGGAFLGGSWRAEWQNVSDASRSFYDEQAALMGSAGGDQFTTWDAYAGYKITSRHIAGVYTSLAEVKNSSQTSHHTSAFLSYSKDEFSYSGGVGVYQSSLQSRSPTVYISVKWTGAKAVGI